MISTSTTSTGFALLWAITCSLLVQTVSGAESSSFEWKFKVFLDEKEIGVHDYVITTNRTATKVETEASFDVKILFFNAFRYRHRNVEYWDSNGMKQIDAFTSSNGKEFVVRGERKDGHFIVNDGTTDQRLPEHLMSFAYWNPSILKENRLLNTQTGVYEPVSIVPLGEDEVAFDGQKVLAQKYDIQFQKGTITVWYDAGDLRWLALESPAKGDRIIRYEPVELPAKDELAIVMDGEKHESES